MVVSVSMLCVCGSCVCHVAWKGIFIRKKSHSCIKFCFLESFDNKDGCYGTETLLPSGNRNRKRDCFPRRWWKNWNNYGDSTLPMIKNTADGGGGGRAGEDGE